MTRTSCGPDAVLGVLNSLSRAHKLREANEAATRLQVIDRVLFACGWLPEDLPVEQPSGTGDYIDYLLRDGRRPWMVIEAKRASRTFALPQATSAFRNLASLHKQSPDVREVLDQAAKYCHDLAAPYACITNGYQWIFFRGLSSPSHPWTKGSALVFESVPDCIRRVKELYKYLAQEHIPSTLLADTLERNAGGAALTARQPIDSLPTLQRRQVRVRPAVRWTADTLFADLEGESRERMLDACYVEPGHSSEFDTTLQRLLKDALDEVDNPGEDTRDGTPSVFVQGLAAEAMYHPIGHPIVVVGNVGAGKTTFLRRVRVELIRKKSVVVAYINLEGRATGGAFSQEEEAKHISRETLTELSKSAAVLVKGRKDISNKELPQTDPDSLHTLTTLYRDILDKEYNLGKNYWQRDAAAWEKRKLELLTQRRDDVVEHLRAFVRHLKRRMPPGDIAEGGVTRRMPVVLFMDNLDVGTDDYQRFVYGFCQQLGRNTGAIIVLCMREDTYRTGRRPGGFLTSSQLQFVFHVASPPLDRVVRLRLDYGQRVLDGNVLPASIKNEAGEVRDALDIVGMVFGRAPSSATALVAAMAGQDVREALRLVRAVTLGVAETGIQPRPSEACVFECLSERLGARWLGHRPGIFNLLDAPPWPVPCHGLPTRLLSYLVRAYEHEKKATLERTERIIVDFSNWGYAPSLIRSVLRSLLRGGMLRSPELSPDEEELADVLPRRLIVTASGHAHVTRLLQLQWYRATMALRARWYDEHACDSFVKECIAAGGRDGVSLGDVCESDAVKTLDAYLTRCLIREDAHLSPEFNGVEWVRDLRARPQVVELDSTGREQDVRPAHAGPSRRSERRVQGQMVLSGFTEAMSLTETRMPAMPSLDPEETLLGSVWVPRILWALTFAERAGHGAQRAADIARVLSEQAGYPAEGSNVARAFRVLDDGPASGLWHGKRGLYTLTAAGKATFSRMCGRG